MKKKLLISIGFTAFVAIAVFNFSINAENSNESTLLSNINIIQSAQAEDGAAGCALVSTSMCTLAPDYDMYGNFKGTYHPVDGYWY